MMGSGMYGRLFLILWIALVSCACRRSSLPGPAPSASAEARAQFMLATSLSPASPPAGKPTQLDLWVYAPDSSVVTNYDVEHEKQAHLIVVSRDLSEFQHLHPELASDGAWRIALQFGEPGPHRVFLDVKPTGQDQQVLSQDLTVAGEARPQPLEPDPGPQQVDGMQVELQSDPAALRVGPAMLRFLVREQSRPVNDLQPYLGAMGHLVILDKSAEHFLHAHPMEKGATATPASEEMHGEHAPPPAPGTSAEVGFHTEFPRAGRYKMWLQIRRQGKVSTAPFVVDVR